MGVTSSARPSWNGVNDYSRSLLGAGVQVGDYVENRGIDLYRLATEKGLEGISAKRKSSIYRPGKRSPDWLKIKSRPQQEFVVCGFTEGKGSRKHFRALPPGRTNGPFMKLQHIIATLLFTATSVFADRTITHDNAESLTHSDSTPYQRMVGKVALAIEKKVKWSDSNDAQTDGSAAFEAFKVEFAKINQKKAPADEEEGNSKFDPELFRTQIGNIVSLDASSDGQLAAYGVAFRSVFNSKAIDAEPNE
jgi:ATP dependent DNA ligase domain